MSDQKKQHADDTTQNLTDEQLKNVSGGAFDVFNVANSPTQALPVDQGKVLNGVLGPLDYGDKLVPPLPDPKF